MTLMPSQDLPPHLNIHMHKLKAVTAHFPMRISSHYRSLIRTADDPIGKQVIPDVRELEDLQTAPDPLEEESQAPVPQVIHRYPHRVIFMVSSQCAAYCRFCMRKRRLVDDAQVAPNDIQQGLDYIQRNRNINEVILSGGDPFMLSDTSLIDILKILHQMPHIRILRIHTRIPNTWPQRITQATAMALSEFHPLYINIHFNHSDEISPQARNACALLADAGIPLGSQTVLLRGINDKATTLNRLFQTLLEARVRPYYLHQLDRVPGTAHFRVPLAKALELLKALRMTLSGQAMPHFMVDLPGGGGKVELLPEVCISQDDRQWVLQNFEGRRFAYPTK